jgi:hypothetical protein
MNAFEKSFKIHPEDPWSRNLLAWTLSTAEEARVSDSDRAVQLAKEACDLKPDWGPYADNG